MTDSADQFTHALSVDIGGTFTDFSLLELSTGRVLVNKVLTDPENPHVALIAGAAELLDDARVDFDCLRMVVHSTTLATNSIIERKGAKTALLTTEGFRDILQMGREQIYDIYDLKAQYPPPLVPRYLRRGVAERVDRDGNVVAPLDVDAAMETMGELREQNVEGVAVSLLHAYKNPEHEQQLKAAIEERFPGCGPIAVVGGRAGRQRVRAHLDDGRGLLRQARRVPLSGVAQRKPGRRGATPASYW